MRRRKPLQVRVLLSEHMISDALFIEVFNKHSSYAAVAAELKIHIKTVGARAKKLNINKNGDRIGTNQPFDLQDVLDGKYPQYPTYRLRNRLIEVGLLEYKCSNCGINEWCNEPVTLELDHKDGDNTNHQLSNLRLMCPNCHSQTATYKSKNKKLKRINGVATVLANCTDLKSV